MIAHQRILSYANYLGRSRHTHVQRGHMGCAGLAVAKVHQVTQVEFFRLVKIHHRMIGHSWVRPPLPPAADVCRGLCVRPVSGTLPAHHPAGGPRRWRVSTSALGLFSSSLASGWSSQLSATSSKHWVRSSRGRGSPRTWNRCCKGRTESRQTQS